MTYGDADFDKLLSADPAALAAIVDECTEAEALRILILEDSIDSRTALARLLSAPWRCIVCAATLAEAFVEAAKSPPDALLCDLCLPDGTGESLLDALPNVPTLVLSGTTDDAVIARVRARAGVEFFQKPVDFKAVGAWVEAVEGAVSK